MNEVAPKGAGVGSVNSTSGRIMKFASVLTKISRVLGVYLIILFCLDRGIGYVRTEISSSSIDIAMALVERGPITIQQLILEKPSILFETDGSGNTLLHRLASIGPTVENVEFAKVCIEMGGDPNARGGRFWRNTPLHLAVKSNNAEFVDLLLSNGAEPNVRNRRGLLPIQFAQKFEYDEIITLLKLGGAKDPLWIDRTNVLPTFVIYFFLSRTSLLALILTVICFAYVLRSSIWESISDGRENIAVGDRS